MTRVFGVGPVIAATVTGDVRDVPRFASQDCFAAYDSTAPIEVSSGKRKVHRLSRHGNRRLNHAIHMAAVTQIRYRHCDGRAYYDKKIAEGRTSKEALRALKRQVSDTTHKHLKADSAGKRKKAPTGKGDRHLRAAMVEADWATVRTATRPGAGSAAWPAASARAREQGRGRRRAHPAEHGLGRDALRGRLHRRGHRPGHPHSARRRQPAARLASHAHHHLRTRPLDPHRSSTAGQGAGFAGAAARRLGSPSFVTGASFGPAAAVYNGHHPGMQIREFCCRRRVNTGPGAALGFERLSQHAHDR